MDLAEYGIGAILSAVFSAPPYSLEPPVLSWVLAAVYIGTIFGAAIAGWLADRLGRRPLILAALAIIVATSAGAAASPDPATLAVMRGLSGLALGAYPPLMVAYLTEILPARLRGPLIMGIVAFGALGQVAVIFLVRALTPSEPFGVEAWRWAYVVGAGMAALCLLLFVRAPESPKWLAAKQERRGKLPPRDIDASVQKTSFAPRMIFLAAIFFLAPWSTIGFSILSGAMLVSKGIAVMDSLFYIGVYSLGATIGAVIFAFFIDLARRKTILVWSALLMVALQFMFSFADGELSIIAVGTAFNIVIAIFLPTLVLYASEILPTLQRGRSTAWSWAMRGIGSFLAPMVLLPILHAWGPVGFSSAIALTLVAFALLVAIFGVDGAAGRNAG